MNNMDYYNYMRSSNMDYSTPLYSQRPMAALNGLAMDMSGLAVQNMSGLAMDMSGLAMDMSGLAVQNLGMHTSDLGFIQKASKNQMYLGALAMLVGSHFVKGKNVKNLLKFGGAGLAIFTLYQSQQK